MVQKTQETVQMPGVIIELQMVGTFPVLSKAMNPSNIGAATFKAGAFSLRTAIEQVAQG